MWMLYICSSEILTYSFFLLCLYLFLALEEHWEEKGKEGKGMLSEGSIQKWIVLPCWGRCWPNRAGAEEQHSCWLLKTSLTTLHELAILLYLTTPTNLMLDKMSQAGHPVRPHQSFCLNTSTRIGHLRNNSRTFINRLNFLRFLKLGFFVVFLFCPFFPFFYSCIINYTITIPLSLFSSSSLSLLLLYYNPLFSLPATLSAPSYPCFSLSSPPTS
jgi:hypothetical protein